MLDPKHVHKYLDLSTAHITGEDMAKLNAEGEEGIIPCAPYRYGVILFVLFHDSPSDKHNWIRTLKEAGYSDALQTLYIAAWTDKVDMIRLDQDSEVSVNLPTFDW